MTPGSEATEPIECLVRGRAVDNTERFETGPWSLPRSTARQLASALKDINRGTPEDLERRLDALHDIGRRGTWIEPAHLRLIAARTRCPIRYLRAAIERANGWLSRAGEYAERFGQREGSRYWQADGSFLHGGLPTALVLAGDSSLLAPWAVGQALLANANLVIKGSAAEPLSSYLLCRALVDRGVRGLHLLYFDRREPDDRALIGRMVAGTMQSVVYGEDATVERVYALANVGSAHRRIGYWTGRSQSVVLDDADVEHAARLTVHGAVEDRGNRCINTKKVFVPQRLLGAFVRGLEAAADALRPGDPLDEDTDCCHGPGERVRILEQTAAEDVLLDRHLIVVRCDDTSPLMHDEHPYPILALRSVAEHEDPIALANASVRDGPLRHALATSVFTADRSRFEAAAQVLRSHKILWNRPSTDNDLRSAHQGVHLAGELMRRVQLVT